MSAGRKKRLYGGVWAVVFIAAASTPLVYADGVSSLSEVAKSQEAMQRILDTETKTFRAVREAVASGVLREGLTQDEISGEYGDPVAVVSEKDAEVWVYKPSYATYFDKNKIRLRFNEKKVLESIERVQGRED
ncbi:MAG: hypothetical protein ABIJ27_00880 [Candidatus Omnitrophota bacterium]